MPELGKPSFGAQLATDQSGSGGTSLTQGTGITINGGNVISAKLSTGIAGGQSVIGGTAASENLTLSSTSHATKGRIIFGTAYYDEAANQYLGASGNAVTAPQFGFVGAATSGVHYDGVGTITLRTNGTSIATFNNSSGIAALTSRMVITTSGSTSTQLDGLFLGASKTYLGIGSTGNFPVEVRINNTSSSEVGFFGWNTTANVFTIGVNSATQRAIDINAPLQLILRSAPTVASAAAATLDAVKFQSTTTTITGTTAITTSGGFNYAFLAAPTYNAAGAVAITNAATLAIEGPPSPTGLATITNAYGLWVQNTTGASARFDSHINLQRPVGQQTITHNGSANGLLINSSSGPVFLQDSVGAVVGPSAGNITISASAAAGNVTPSTNDDHTNIGTDANRYKLMRAVTGKFNLLNLASPQIAVGGGAAATLGTIGGTGPTAAAMSGWYAVTVNGLNRFIPLWA